MVPPAEEPVPTVQVTRPTLYFGKPTRQERVEEGNKTPSSQALDRPAQEPLSLPAITITIPGLAYVLMYALTYLDFMWELPV